MSHAKENEQTSHETRKSPGPETTELLAAAQRGDTDAKLALVTRAVPYVKAILRGRLPAAARGYEDTNDLAQDAILQTLRRLDRVTPRHAGAMPAYMGKAGWNLVRDHARAAARHPRQVELDDQIPSSRPSALNDLMRQENRRRVRRELRALSRKDQQILTLSAEGDRSLADIARLAGLPSAAAASMAIIRAERRLKDQLIAHSKGA
jgi:RNA polymerase sigma factor (sigma-70 family)